MAAYILVFTIIGPENHGSHFERGKTAFQSGASKEDVSTIPDADRLNDTERSSMGSGGKEKADIQHVENERSARNSV